MKPVIEIHNISKAYNIKGKTQNTSFAEEIYDFFKRKKHAKQNFHALHDISLSINRGESVGIIGANGAGKSTLLKILSGVTTPSSGHIISRGTISSILEVGAGFHPELTGRENIYLSGAIHGFSRSDMKSKMDEIIAFSGVEQFIDTPFKHYSSGMQVRLGFAIISHIESDVLITDEVLAVGDVSFQKKSLQKMKETFKEGRTIIFVSHQQSMISTLTQRCALIEYGKLIADGPTEDVIKDYFYERDTVRAIFKNEETVSQMQYAKLIEAGITNVKGDFITDILDVSDTYQVYMDFEILQKNTYPVAAIFQFKTAEGYLAFVSHHDDFREEELKEGKSRVICTIPKNLLNTGQYHLTLSLVTQQPFRLEHFIHENCLSFTIKDKQPTTLTNFYGDYTGWISPKINWKSYKL